MVPRMYAKRCKKNHLCISLRSLDIVAFIQVGRGVLLIICILLSLLFSWYHYMSYGLNFGIYGVGLRRGIYGLSVARGIRSIPIVVLSLWGVQYTVPRYYQSTI